MYPINDIQKLNGSSLLEAIVHFGGCTGSFVSHDGLILSNHYCAFGAVAAASAGEHDGVTNGFLASAHAGEIPAKGQTLRIIESFRDVTLLVLAGAT